MRNPFSSKKNNDTVEGQPITLRALNLVMNDNKAQQVEDATLKQIYNWLVLCIQNGGNSDHVVLALIKSYFKQQINGQMPSYKEIPDKFIKKIEKLLTDYFRLKALPLVVTDSVIGQVIPDSVDEKEQKIQSEVDQIAQSKKIINDSMEHWIKESESMSEHMKKTFKQYNCFNDEEMLEYDKVAANMLDANGRYTSLIGRFADKMLSSPT